MPKPKKFNGTFYIATFTGGPWDKERHPCLWVFAESGAAYQLDSGGIYVRTDINETTGYVDYRWEPADA